MKQTAVHSEFKEGEVRAHSLSGGKEIRRGSGKTRDYIEREQKYLMFRERNGNSVGMVILGKAGQSDRRREKAHGTYSNFAHKLIHMLHSKQIWE